MTSLLLNIAAPQATPGPVLGSGRPGDLGALFVASAAPTLAAAGAVNAQHFGAMLRDAQPAIPDELSADTAPQAADSAPGATREEPVDEYVLPEYFAETMPALDPTTQAPAAVMPVVAATFVIGEAVAVQEARPASVVQLTMTVMPGAPQGLAPQVSMPLTAVLAFAAPPSPAESSGHALPESSLLQLASQSVTAAAATLSAFTGDATPTKVVDRQGNVARQPLEALLGERLQMQIARRSEHAVIRLDPPSMGTIEIVIRQEAGQIHVQMRASNSEVARQLHVIGEALRQDLVQRQHGDVSVQVSDASRDGERQRQRAPLPWQDEPGRALNETGEEHGSFAMTPNE